jgi:hypothetical protein
MLSGHVTVTTLPNMYAYIGSSPIIDAKRLGFQGSSGTKLQRDEPGSYEVTTFFWAHT